MSDYTAVTKMLEDANNTIKELEEEVVEAFRMGYRATAGLRNKVEALSAAFNALRESGCWAADAADECPICAAAVEVLDAEGPGPVPELYARVVALEKLKEQTDEQVIQLGERLNRAVAHSTEMESRMWELDTKLSAAKTEVSRLEKYADSVKSIGDNLALERDKWKSMAEDFIKMAEKAWDEAGKAVSMQAHGWLEDLTKKMWERAKPSIQKFPFSADELAELEGDAVPFAASPRLVGQTPEEQAADPARMRRERDHYRELYIKYGREHYYNMERVLGWRTVADSQDKVIDEALKHVEALMVLVAREHGHRPMPLQYEAAHAWFEDIKKQKEEHAKAEAGRPHKET